MRVVSRKLRISFNGRNHEHGKYCCIGQQTLEKRAKFLEEGAARFHLGDVRLNKLLKRGTVIHKLKEGFGIGPGSSEDYIGPSNPKPRIASSWSIMAGGWGGGRLQFERLQL